MCLCISVFFWEAADFVHSSSQIHVSFWRDSDHQTKQQNNKDLNSGSTFVVHSSVLGDVLVLGIQRLTRPMLSLTFSRFWVRPEKLQTESAPIFRIIVLNFAPNIALNFPLYFGHFLGGGNMTGGMRHLCGKSVRRHAPHKWHNAFPQTTLCVVWKSRHIASSARHVPVTEKKRTPHLGPPPFKSPRKILRTFHALLPGKWRPMKMGRLP